MNHSWWAVTGDLLSTLSCEAHPHLRPLYPLPHYSPVTRTLLFKPFAWNLHLTDLHTHCPHGGIMAEEEKEAQLLSSFILFKYILLLILLIPCKNYVSVSACTYMYTSSPSVVPAHLWVCDMRRKAQARSLVQHTAESDTTPSPKVSAFSSKHTHLSQSCFIQDQQLLMLFL